MNTTLRRRLCGVALLPCTLGAVTLAGLSLESREAQLSPQPVTFNRDIAPILYKRCATCHRPNEVAPFSLLTYADAKPRARQIGTVTKARIMPPWLPEPGVGEFEGDRRLSDQEIATIQAWVEAGAPEGNATDLPPQPQWSDGGWQLGQPDLIVSMPVPYTVKPGGADVFRNFAIPISIADSHFIRGIEFRPGNPRVVHHARMMIDRSPSSRQLDERDPEPGYDGMLVDQAEFPDGQFLGWSPGRSPTMLDTGLAWRLEKGSDLVMQLHLLPTGRQEEIQARVGLYFSDRPPTRHPYLLRIGPKTIDIAPGNPRHVIEDQFSLPVDVDLYSVYPHAHYLAREMTGTATLPSGAVQPLLSIKEWNFNWQDEYRYKRPIALPKGTTLSMRFVYDNSSDNPRNPNQPPKRVTYGGQSFEEMGDLLLQVVPRSERDFTQLDRAFGRKEAESDVAGYTKMLAEDPGDFLKHDALAAVLLRLGRLDEAIKELRESVRLNPTYAPGHYNLGSALSAKNDLDGAIAEFLAALKLDPGRAEAHNNLAIAFQARGRLADAIDHYRQAIKIDPAFAFAHNNLGNALAIQGRVREAVAEYRVAIRIDPDYVEAHHNLGDALAALGNLAEALNEYRRALQIRPDYAEARHNLASALIATGHLAEGVEQLRLGVRTNPEFPASAAALAWILATCPDDTIRAPREAIKLAEGVSALAQQRNPSVLDTLAAAYAADGQFQKAIAIAERALPMLTGKDATELAAAVKERLALYRQGKAYREDPSGPGR